MIEVALPTSFGICTLPIDRYMELKHSRRMPLCYLRRMPDLVRCMSLELKPRQRAREYDQDIVVWTRCKRMQVYARLC